MKKKYSTHLRQAEEDRKLEKQEAGKRSNCTEKRADLSGEKKRTDLHQCAHMKPDAAQKDSHSGERRGDQSHRMVAAPQEIAGAVSLTSVRLYIPFLCWPEASPLTQMGNIETIVHCKVVEGKKKNMLA